MASEHRVCLNLIDVVATWLAGPYREFKLFEGVHVSDRSLSVTADAEHGAFALSK
jgi:hypothetical protein